MAKNKPKAKGRNGRRYSKDAIAQAVSLYQNPYVPIEAIIAALGCTDRSLRMWAEERGVKRPQSPGVSGEGLAGVATAAEAGRATVRRVGMLALERAEGQMGDTPAKVVPGLIVAGTKAISEADGWRAMVAAAAVGGLLVEGFKVELASMFAMLLARKALSDVEADQWISRVVDAALPPGEAVKAG